MICSMKDTDKDMEFFKYFQFITPNEIDIDREDIFYRDKYTDITNYLKNILTNHEESLIQSYSKFIQPKGAILINVMAGTDIVDYLKLISKKYYLNYFELNQREIIHTPEDFIENFTFILEKFPTIKDIIKEDKYKITPETRKMQGGKKNKISIRKKKHHYKTHKYSYSS